MPCFSDAAMETVPPSRENCGGKIYVDLEISKAFSVEISWGITMPVIVGEKDSLSQFSDFNSAY